MSGETARTAWGRRRGRFFVHDPHSNLFAPSKLAGCTRIPKALSPDEPLPYNPTMNVRAYSRIPHDTPIFDGRKAWQKISSLGFQVTKASNCPARVQEHLRSWMGRYQFALHADFNESEILVDPMRVR